MAINLVVLEETYINIAKTPSVIILVKVSVWKLDGYLLSSIHSNP